MFQTRINAQCFLENDQFGTWLTDLQNSHTELRITKVYQLNLVLTTKD